MSPLVRRYGRGGFSGVVAALVVGCASTRAATPKELIDARSAYDRAARGPAAQYDPADLRVARRSLDGAERWNAQDPAAAETRTEAYLALRRAQTAEAQGEIGVAVDQRQQAETELVQVLRHSLEATNVELEQAKSDLAEAQRTRSVVDDRAMASLERRGGPRRDKGKVIVLPGELLFPVGQSNLSPASQERLDAVAAALKKAPNRVITIEGYTDDTGTDAVNRPLSAARAEAVRDYLASRGIPSDKIAAKGLGSNRPVASNGTEEGRAANRRVEITVPIGVTESMPETPSTKP